MFVHAISGCDTVSAPYMKKAKRELLNSYVAMVSTFTEPRSTPVYCKCRRNVLAKVVCSHQIDIAGQTLLHPVHSICQSIISVIRVQT